jgi:hypothetical protein
MDMGISQVYNFTTGELRCKLQENFKRVWQGLNPLVFQPPVSRLVA